MNNNKPDLNLLKDKLTQLRMTAIVPVGKDKIEPTLTFWDVDLPCVSFWYNGIIVNKKKFSIQVVVDHRQQWRAELYFHEGRQENVDISFEWLPIFLVIVEFTNRLNEHWFDMLQECGYS